MEEKKVFKLSQLCSSIEKFFEKHLGNQQFWIKAEISSFNLNKRSGHAYVELIEEVNAVKVASLRASIWARTLQSIRATLGSDFNNVLKAGSEIVFLASVNYHKVYGLSLIITEVDLSFNLGELERRKQATIKQLKAEGIFDNNKALNLPVVVQYIALIGAPETAGFTDFVNHIQQNDKGYNIEYDVYKSSVQGVKAPAELLKAFQLAEAQGYDAIVLLRGGGSKLDLDAYNELNLCRAVAQSSVPVISGIGHETDLSVVDMVAHSPVKTPTAVASFLINRMVDFEAKLYNNYILIARFVHNIISGQKETLEGYIQALRRDPINRCQLNRGELHNLTNHIARMAKQVTSNAKEELSEMGVELRGEAHRIVKTREPQVLENIQRQILQLTLGKLALSKAQLEAVSSAVTIVDPQKTLSRGFSIVRNQGEAVQSVKSLNVSDVLQLELSDGHVEAEIKKIKK